MTEKSLKFNSWVVSATSILYGIMSVIMASTMDANMFAGSSTYSYTYYILYFMLMIFGIMKIVGIIFNKRHLRRVSIVALMFVWGFVWTSKMIEFFLSNPNREVITVLPIIAIAGYIAVRGDYN